MSPIKNWNAPPSSGQAAVEGRQRRRAARTDSDEIPRLVAATTERYRLLVELSVLTGVRQSEALGLQFGDLRLDEARLDVRRQLDRNGRCAALKTKKARRTVPLTASFVRQLRAHRQEALATGQARPENFVFRGDDGGAMKHRTIVRHGLVSRRSRRRGSTTTLTSRS